MSPNILRFRQLFIWCFSLVLAALPQSVVLTAPDAPPTLINSAVPPAPANPVMPGFAIAALHAGCNANAFTVRGNGALIIRDGGVFVNAPAGCNAINMAGTNVRLATASLTACPDASIPPSQTGGCYIDGPYPLATSGMQAVGTPCPDPTPGNPINWWTAPLSNCNLYPAVQTGVPQIPTPTAPISTTDFTCGPARTTPLGGGTLLPGTYADGMNASSSATLTLTAGIYCITGVSATNRIMRANSIIGHDVFIYISPTLAILSSSGSTLDLAPITNCDANPALCPLLGIVLYKPYGPDTCSATDIEIGFNGPGDVFIRGLIWAPQSFLDYTGQGNLTMTGQALVGCARLAKSDSTTTDIIYENLLYSAPVGLRGIAVAALHPNCASNLFTLTGAGGSALIIRDGGVFVNAPPGCSNAINLASGDVHLATASNTFCPDAGLPPDQDGGCYIDGVFPILTSGSQTEGVNCSPPSPKSPIDWWSATPTNCTFYPPVQTGLPQTLTLTPPITPKDFECGPARTTPAAGGTLLPGTYVDGLNSSLNSTLTLTPGIYCITGTNAANRIMRANAISGHGVFIYIAPAAAEIDFGGAYLDLSPLTACTETHPVPCNLLGIVLYKPDGPDTCDNSSIDIGLYSQGEMHIRGMIWAPESFLEYNGQGDLYMRGQTLVGCVRYSLSSATNLRIVYEDIISYRTEPPPSK